MSGIDLVKVRAQLEHERDRIANAIDYLESENPGNMQEELGDVGGWGSEDHLGDMASVTFDRELDEGLGEGAQQTLAQIEKAIARIDDGTYGTCERCGNPIAEDRLRARPWATLCIDDQRLADRG